MNWRQPESHQPDRETNQSLYGQTNELETVREPDTTSKRETNESLYGETNELETGKEPDTTSQTGREMNWRQSEPDNPEPVWETK